MAKSRKSEGLQERKDAHRHSSGKKKRALLPWTILALLVLAGLWYFTRPAPAPAPAVNVTPPVTGIQEGDLVAIDYVLTLANGSVVDTTNKMLAREYNIATYTKDQFRFIVGQSGKVKGFDEAVVGMELNQTLTKNILLSEQVLVITKNLTRRVVRNQPFPRFRDLSEDKFKLSFGKKPVVGDIVVREDQPFPFMVINISNGAVRIEPHVRERQKIKLPGYEWESEVVIKTSNGITIRHNPNPGQIITTEFGPARVDTEPGILNITYLVKPGQELTYNAAMNGGPGSMPYQFRVTAVTDEDFTLTRINYLPQEMLILKVHVLEWTKDVKAPKTANRQERINAITPNISN